MLCHNISASAHRMASSAVTTENGGIAVEKCEIIGAAWIGLFVSAIEHVVHLIGSVPGVAPHKSSSN